MSGKVDFNELTAALALAGASWDKDVWPFVRRFARTSNREVCYIDCCTKDASAQSAKAVLQAYGIIGVVREDFGRFLSLYPVEFSEVVENIPEGVTR